MNKERYLAAYLLSVVVAVVAIATSLLYLVAIPLTYSLSIGMGWSSPVSVASGILFLLLVSKVLIAIFYCKMALDKNREESYPKLKVHVLVLMSISLFSSDFFLAITQLAIFFFIHTESQRCKEKECQEDAKPKEEGGGNPTGESTPSSASELKLNIADLSEEGQGIDENETEPIDEGDSAKEEDDNPTGES